jgi:N-ethylmaleimide reductase
MVLAPMTRVRADARGRVPAMTAEYYAQRATGGLLVTEATQVLPNGKGGPGTPGIHDAEQVAAWRRVTDAVHARGGRIFVQLWHTGRAAHPSFLPEGEEVVGASPLPIEGDVWTPAGRQPYATPRPLTLDEIPRYVAAFADAARNAVAAGFDGVEVHGANGYLLDQFLQDGSNRAPTPTAARSRTAPACCSRSPAPRPTRSAPTAWACACRRTTRTRAWRTATRRPRSATSPARSRRSASPTCT